MKDKELKEPKVSQSIKKINLNFRATSCNNCKWLSTTFFLIQIVEGGKSHFVKKFNWAINHTTSKCWRCRQQPAATTQQLHQQTGQKKDYQLRIKWSNAQQQATVEKSTLSNCCVPTVPGWGFNFQKMKLNLDIFSTVQDSESGLLSSSMLEKGLFSNRR